jgi:probable F420-dependent oxidoreductase
MQGRTTVKFGVHLPQFGRAASPETIAKAARQAEDLGFAHVWVSDHLGVPVGMTYPPAFMYEPVVTLTWAAAVTSRVRLGTSVLVIPYRPALHMAKELASLDRLSGGRLLLGAALGWLREEFEALGVPIRERAARAEESIAAIRACWTDKVVNFEGSTIRFKDLRVLPRPEQPIPIWLGGSSGAALDRAIRIGDGWHGLDNDPEVIASKVSHLRSARPEESFRISNRVNWTPNAVETFVERMADFKAAGVQDMVVVPTGNDEDSWFETVEDIARRCAV